MDYNQRAIDRQSKHESREGHESVADIILPTIHFVETASSVLRELPWLKRVVYKVS